MDQVLDVEGGGIALDVSQGMVKVVRTQSQIL